MSQFLRTCTLAFVAFSMAFVAGCGSAHDATVHGVVTLDGTPLTSGEVQFHPVSGNSGTAYGRMIEGGAYQLTTGTESGIDPGEYKVTVVAKEPFPDNLPPNTTPPIRKVISPMIYSTLDTTPLKFTVVAGDNTIDLALTAK